MENKIIRKELITNINITSIFNRNKFTEQLLNKYRRILKTHSITIEPNPWLALPPPKIIESIPYKILILEAQQQAIQHSLLKHILSCRDLNSRVKGIAAYERYEVLLRELKSGSYDVSRDRLETIYKEMKEQICHIYKDEHKRQTYSDAQKRVVEALWNLEREFTQGNPHASTISLSIKKIHHCWALRHTN
ncbi:MAG: hypothetical protein WC222_08270 [Parachlamydiales bacterium]|jgi:hypothetical protein